MPARRKLSAVRHRAEVTALGSACLTAVTAVAAWSGLVGTPAWWYPLVLAGGLWIIAPVLSRDSGPFAERSRHRMLRLTCAAAVPPVLFAGDLLSAAWDGWSLVAMITAVVIYPMLMIWLYTGVRHLEITGEELEHLARNDHLTGLANRRTAQAHLQEMSHSAATGAHPLTVAIIDLDHFKHYNDTLGHAAGDALLIGASHAWRTRLASDDHLSRHGGEEFLLITTRTPADTVHLIARLAADTPQGQTFSVGIAPWDEAETLTDLLARADRALYDAKAAGRNTHRVAAVAHPVARP